MHANFADHSNWQDYCTVSIDVTTLFHILLITLFSYTIYCSMI